MLKFKIKPPRHEDLLGSGGTVSTFLTTSLHGGEWSACSGRSSPWESAPSTHWFGSWEDLRAGLDDVEKCLVSAGNRIAIPRPFSP
jgi:hypothetical protein